MVFWLYAVCSHSVTAAAVTAAVCKSDRRLTQLFCTNYLFHSMWHFVKRHTITQKYQRKIKSWNHWTLQKSPPQWKSRIAAQKNFPICDSISSILLNGFMHSRYSAFAAMWKPTKSHTHKNAHTYLFAQILRSVYCSANDSITWWNSRHEHFSSGFFYMNVSATNRIRCHIKCFLVKTDWILNNAEPRSTLSPNAPFKIVCGYVMTVAGCRIMMQTYVKNRPKSILDPAFHQQ